jgi:Na+/proline symporter
MNRNWRDWRNWRDLFGGILLVPVLDYSFILLIEIGNQIIGGAVSKYISAGWIAVLLMLVQFFCWISVMLYFHRRRRFPVVAGIWIGMIITVLLWIAIFGIACMDGYTDIRAVVVPAGLRMMTLYGFYARSRRQ